MATVGLRAEVPGVMVPATLTPQRVELQPLFDRLVPAYVDYCRTVSRRSMAMSIESCTLLWHLCRFYRARAVCDLGSGFTSYVLALYASEADYPVTVHSVDDAPEWLERTGSFLARHGMDTGGLLAWAEWRQLPDCYDVIVHDFASGDLRNDSMTDAALRLNTPGAVLFDDGHHDGHAANAALVAEAHGLTLVDVRALTLDQVRRFAMLAYR